MGSSFKIRQIIDFLTNYSNCYFFHFSVKPTLKKVSKYENKFAKLQKKAAEFNFRNQLKVVKKKEFTLEEEDKEVSINPLFNFFTFFAVKKDYFAEFSQIFVVLYTHFFEIQNIFVTVFFSQKNIFRFFIFYFWIFGTRYKKSKAWQLYHKNLFIYLLFIIYTFFSNRLRNQKNLIGRKNRGPKVLCSINAHIYFNLVFYDFIHLFCFLRNESFPL